MSSTDELRSLLDIHGLRWSNYGERETRWYGTLDGIEWSEWTAVEYGPYLRVTCGDCGELLSPAEVVAVSIAYSSICTSGERTSDERGTCGEWRNECTYYDPTGVDAELWCEHCDEPLEVDWDFCPYCGRKVMVDA